MDLLNIIPPLLLGVLAGLMTLALLKILFTSIFGNSSNLIERWKIRSKEEQLKKADQAIQAEEYKSALRILRESFYLDQVRGDPGLIERINSHHLGVLGRVVALADHYNVQLRGLPILEDLLINRLQLMRLYRERLASNRKHEERKRGTPEWAAAELARQRSELLDKIKTNRLSIKLELDRVFGALEHGNTTEEVTYH